MVVFAAKQMRAIQIVGCIDLCTPFLGNYMSS